MILIAYMNIIPNLKLDTEFLKNQNKIVRHKKISYHNTENES